MGDLHQISRSGDQENWRLDIFKLLPGHHGRVAEQGGELLVLGWFSVQCFDHSSWGDHAREALLSFQSRRQQQ